jgi:hypothetical protein
MEKRVPGRELIPVSWIQRFTSITDQSIHFNCWFHA